MYYETSEGDDELQLLFRAAQAKLVDEDEEEEEEEEEKEELKPKAVRSPRRRRNEASMLEQENQSRQAAINSRPKRRAAAERSAETSSGQQRIDDFIAKKRSRIAVKSTRTKRTTTETDSILPRSPSISTTRCPMCDRLVLSDALEEHTNACMNQSDDAAKQLVAKSKQRAAAEANMKKVLFKRTTRKTHTPASNNETTVCDTCGMQMTVFRLENQHKSECSRRISPRQKTKVT